MTQNLAGANENATPRTANPSQGTPTISAGSAEPLGGGAALKKGVPKGDGYQLEPRDP